MIINYKNVKYLEENFTCTFPVCKHLFLVFGIRHGNYSYKEIISYNMCFILYYSFLYLAFRTKKLNPTIKMPLKLGRKNRYSADKLFTCHIKLLDSTIVDLNIPLAAKGKDCLERISSKIGLHEVSDQSVYSLVFSLYSQEDGVLRQRPL